MRATNLPSPGLLANGNSLRFEAARAISSVEIVNDKTPGGLAAQGPSNSAEQLKLFFIACAAQMVLISPQASN
jgi:hypothetical protein